MRVLLDTNVVLDVLLQRGPWLANAQVIWQAAHAGRLTGCVTASALTDVHYISRRLVGASAARQVVRDCLDALEVLTVTRADLELAYQNAGSDFEDALQLACATREAIDAIVTRDPAGFAGASIPVWSPADLVARLQPPGSPGSAGGARP